MEQNKRRKTLQNIERVKKNRQTQYFLQLGKCSQIPHDDKQIIRKMIKQYEQEVVNIFQNFKKNKNQSDLQIKLRKYIQIKKQILKGVLYNEHRSRLHTQEVYSQCSHPISVQNSGKVSPQREETKKKVINLDISELKKKIQSCRQQKLIIQSNSKKRLIENKREISISKIKSLIPQLKQQSISNKNIKSHRQLKLNRYQSKQNIGQQPKRIQRKQSKSKIVINLNPKQKITMIPQTKYMQDVTNLIYSDSIKSIVQNKLKQKQTNNNQSKDSQKSYYLAKQQNYNISIKRPCKNYQIYNDINYQRQFKQKNSQFLPLYLHSNQIKINQQTTRINTLEQIKYPHTFRVQHDKQNQYSYQKQNSQSTTMRASLVEDQFEQGYFFKRIKQIMQSKPKY